MIVNGYNNLCNYEKKINAMNVFPVSDGDTGTNMRTTLENGIKSAKPNNHLGEYLKALSTGMLWGARGNSGVILSQLFKGFYDRLARCSIADVGEVRDALVLAYKTAYRSIVHPVEGTILTVAREGIEKSKKVFTNEHNVNDVFSLYLAEMRKSFTRLPDLLPVLKEAGVMDSGALGYIVIVEGMLKAMYDETVIITDGVGIGIEAGVQNDGSSSFNADSSFDLGYCTEFLLQTLKSRSKFNLNDFTKQLSAMGDSLIVIENDGVVKVHVHTLTPSKVIEEAQKYGEFTAFKLENMQLQHSEFVKAKESTATLVRKKFAVVAVAEGDGITQMYKDCGADIVIAGGNAMGVPASEFSAAYQSANADCIVVLPNNGNNITAAEQAKELSGVSNVTVLPTKTIVEGYYALANGTSDISDSQARIEAMTDGIQAAVTVSVARSVKDYSSAEVSCKEGDMLGFIGKKPTCASSSLAETFVSTLLKVEDIEDKSCVFIIKGKAFDVSEEEIAEELEKRLPDLSYEFVDGGQNVYVIVAGVL